MMNKVTLEQVIERAKLNNIDDYLSAYNQDDQDAIHIVLNTYFSIANNEKIPCSLGALTRKISIEPYASSSSINPLRFNPLIGQILYMEIKDLLISGMNYNLFLMSAHIHCITVYADNCNYDLFIIKTAELTDDYAYAILWRKFEKDFTIENTKRNELKIELIKKDSEYGKIDIDFCDIVKRE